MANILEPFAVGVGIASLGLNLGIIAIVARQLRENASLGLKMVLVVAAFDLVAPITGVVQEALSLETMHNVMANDANCQILGAVHSVIPFMSTTSVAIVALERCLYIHERSLRPRTYLLIALATLALSTSLAFLTAADGGFELTPSRIACNMSPRRGVFGAAYFYTFLASLVVNCSVIVVCYTSIVLLGFRPTAKLRSNSLNQPIDCHASRFPCPKTFALRAVVIMASYLAIIAPCILLMVYEATTGRRPTYAQSSVFVMLLFSFTLVNPILLILLHTSISRAFSHPFRAILKRLRTT